MKVQLFLSCLYWLEELCNFLLSPMTMILNEQCMLSIFGSVIMYMLYTIVKQTNFNRDKSTSLKNQKQSKKNEVNY